MKERVLVKNIQKSDNSLWVGERIAQDSSVRRCAHATRIAGKA